MRKTIFRLALLATIATATATITACGGDEITTTNGGSSDSGTSSQLDDYDSVNFNRAVAVTFSQTGSAKVEGCTDEIVATIDGNGVTIVNSGTDRVQYNISGSSSDGYLKIYSAKRQALKLSGVELTNSRGAAINVQGPTSKPSGGKATYIVLEGNNTIADGTTYTLTPDGEDEKATLFSEGQLLISGSGSLKVSATGKAGITSDDYVRIYGTPSINITSSAGHGLRGKDSVYVDGGVININLTANGKKGISTDGSCYISGGNTTIVNSGATVVSNGDTAKAACIKADGDFYITDGSLTLTATGTGAKGISCDGQGHFMGGTLKATVSGSNFGNSGGGGWGPWGGNSSNSTGAKGIKCDDAITISGGDISINCTNHEAIESKATINILGGTVYCYSKGDDAINSASHMTIEGGYVCGHSDGNDGLDANGNLYIKGGLVYAITTRGNPEVAIDANTEGGYKLYVEGGTLIAVGGLERGSSLTQTCYQASSFSKNSWYALTTATGTTYAFKTPSGGNSLVVSAGSSQPTLTSGITRTGGEGIFAETLYLGSSISGGTNVNLSTYNNNSGGGGGGGGWWW